jgi:hypothetical protein
MFQVILNIAYPEISINLNLTNVTIMDNNKVETSTPAWHTPLPDIGTKATVAHGIGEGYRSVVYEAMKDAISAVSNHQKIGDIPLFAFIFPAKDDMNGLVRFIPVDQKPPSPWESLNTPAYEIGWMTNEQISKRLHQELGRAPIIGIAPKQENAPIQTGKKSKMKP